VNLLQIQTQRRREPYNRHHSRVFQRFGAFRTGSGIVIVPYYECQPLEAPGVDSSHRFTRRRLSTMDSTTQQDCRSTVLLIDDEPCLLEAFRRALRNEPYEILLANSAEEGMQIVSAQKVDLVVCDERMPGMSGTEFLTWLTDAFPQIIRILFTGQATTAEARRALNEGKIFRILDKPCRLADLGESIRGGLEYVHGLNAVAK